MIRCRTLGPLRITIDGADPPVELLWRKNTALLVYLARSPDRSRTREHLCGLLWPEKPDGAAKHSLNEALRNIRRAGGDETLDSDARAVSLTAGAVSLDVDDLADALAAEDWETAGPLAQGVFMDGFGVADCSDLEDWLAFERRKWRARSVRVLSAWAEKLLAQGDLTGGETAARRAQTLDPLSDIAAQSVLRSLALRGDRGEALSHFEAFALALLDQLGSEPAPETVRLADRVRRERTWRLPAAVVPVDGTGRTELIARSTEMSAVSAVWANSRASGRAGLLLIEGEAGVGKTRLLEDLASRARLDGAVVLAVRAVSADRDIPGSAVVGLAEGGLVDAPGVLDADAEAVATMCASSASWREHFGEEFGGEAATPLPRAFSRVLAEVAAQQPALLLLDDAQWLDPLSIETIDLVIRDLARAPALIVLGADLPGGQDLFDRLESTRPADHPFARMRLARWDTGDIEELVEAILPEYDAQERERLARRIAADSGGIPLLAVELATAVRDGLEIGEGGGRPAWPDAARTLDQTMPSDLPGMVRSAIRVNYRRFSARAQEVAAVASILGDRFTVAELRNLTGSPLQEIDEALDELERRRWLYSEPRGYGFVARIVRTVILEDMLTPGQRRRLDARAVAKHGRSAAS